MGRLHLLLAFHNHQPVGNFGHVFRQSHDRCYVRLLGALETAPHVRCALHHTGALLDWLEAEEPTYLTRLRALVERGQVEILGGGLYEPMLAVLPERDASRQIEAMAERCRRLFGVTPRGMWLAERVWDPDLPRILEGAGIAYTLLDDTHFHAAGVGGGGDRLGGYYLTEKAGASCALFPIDKALRYAIPFRLVDELVGELRAVARATTGDRALTYGDDGEKFGVWPGTEAWVWEKGWLASFFAALKDAAPDVVTAPPGEWLASARPEGRVYLPTASYEEMGEWSLPAAAIPPYLALRHDLEARGELDRVRAFVRGGIWQGFLAKYPEANWMHKRCLQVSRRYAARAEQAPDALLRAQCNCAYWHGMFGGLYLSNLRHAVFANLIEAEASLQLPAEEIGDVDVDGRDERALASTELFVVADAESGAVKEIDIRAARFNLTNVLARREEGYHAALASAERARESRASLSPESRAPASNAPPNAEPNTPATSIHSTIKMKEPNLTRFLRHDDAPRWSFRLRRIHAGADLDAVERGEGSDLPAAADTRATAADLRVEGPTLTASFSPPAPPPGARWAVELNFTLLTPDAPDRRCLIPGSDDLRPGARGVHPGADQFRLEDGWAHFAATVNAPGAAELWRYPIETVSQSEDGFERTYQGTCFLFVYPSGPTGPTGPTGPIGAAPSTVTLRVEALP